MRRHAWRSRVKEPNNSMYSAASLALWVIFIRCKRPQIYASGMTISPTLAKILGVMIADVQSVCGG